MSNLRAELEEEFNERCDHLLSDLGKLKTANERHQDENENLRDKIQQLEIQVSRLCL